MSLPIYLASRSPRRKELLAHAGLRFRVYVPKEEELAFPPSTRRETPSAIVKRIAGAKAAAAVKELAAAGRRSGVILAADTLVFLDGKVLGKPADAAEAKRMLKRLSGRRHEVQTGVACALLGPKGAVKASVISVRTGVEFFPLSDAWLDWYVGTGEPLDKAGAYGAQTFGAAMIRSFSGSYTNVVGLPVGESLSLLEKVSGQTRTQLMEKKR